MQQLLCCVRVNARAPKMNTPACARCSKQSLFLASVNFLLASFLLLVAAIESPAKANDANERDTNLTVGREQFAQDVRAERDNVQVTGDETSRFELALNEDNKLSNETQRSARLMEEEEKEKKDKTKNGDERKEAREKVGKILDYTTSRSLNTRTTFIGQQAGHSYFEGPTLFRNQQPLRRLIAQSATSNRRATAIAKSADGKQRQQQQRERDVEYTRREQANEMGTDRGENLHQVEQNESGRQAKYVITPRRNGASRLRDILTRNLFYLGSNVLATLIPLASLLASSWVQTGDRQQLTRMSSKNELAQESADNNLIVQQAANNNNKTKAKLTIASFLTGPQTFVDQLASGLNVGSGLQARVEHVMSWLERSIEHLPNFPRLHPQECVKRSICEAHHEPSKYGALGLVLRLLFPATNLSATEGQDNMEYKVINKYRHAAGYGMARRRKMAAAVESAASNSTVSDGGNGNAAWTAASSGDSYPGACKEKYEDCLVSLLDVAQNLVDFFLRKS